MKVVDDWITVSEEEIESAVLGMAEQHKKIIEGAAGVAVAAFIKDSKRNASIPAIIVVCGANIGLDSLRSVLSSRSEA
jgi:threonine dehydratase